MVLLLPLLLLALMLTAQPQAGVLPPVARMDVTGVQTRAFEASSVRRPLVISSVQEAAIYLPAQDLARLSHEVDFSQQVLLVFASLSALLLFHGSLIRLSCLSCLLFALWVVCCP